VGVVLLTRKTECGQWLPSGGRTEACHSERSEESGISCERWILRFAQDDGRYANQRFAPAIPQNSRQRRQGKPLDRCHRLCRWTKRGLKSAKNATWGRGRVAWETLRAPDCDGVSAVTCVVSRRRCWPLLGAASPANSLFRWTYWMTVGNPGSPAKPGKSDSTVAAPPACCLASKSCRPK
jgi:hypothetical protein